MTTYPHLFWSSTLEMLLLSALLRAQHTLSTNCSVTGGYKFEPRDVKGPRWRRHWSRSPTKWHQLKKSLGKGEGVAPSLRAPLKKLYPSPFFSSTLLLVPFWVLSMCGCTPNYGAISHERSERKKSEKKRGAGRPFVPLLAEQK